MVWRNLRFPAPPQSKLRSEISLASVLIILHISRTYNKDSSWFSPIANIGTQAIASLCAILILMKGVFNYGENKIFGLGST